MNRLNQERLSLWQLFVLLVMFEAGSAVVVGIANEAKQDAWIAVLMAGIGGLFLAWMYHAILAPNPGLGLYQLFERCFGKIPGIGLSVIYILYFLYISSRVLRDFDELISSAVLPNTPTEVVSFLVMLVIGYLLYLGIEVLGRSSEIFFPYAAFFFWMMVVFLFISGRVKFSNLQPVLENGWGPIFQSIFPSLITFPFGEFVVLLVLFSSISNFKTAKWVAFTGIGFGGFIIFVSLILQICILGVNSKIRASFPLLNVAREISIANFLERVDAFIVFIIMVGIIVKVSIFFYVGLKGLEHIFHISYRSFVFPCAMLVSVMSIYIAENYAEHIEEGLRFVPIYLHIPFQIIIPCLLLVTSRIKTKKV
ncbi:spore germination protein [Fodinisporobacter ferrooxydans]|uniref:Spore germination protein n=1 Tax=Fodinisporobacter ferrooxydans TaxID=2901836 RepID=A0ABY4CQ48_9BACL|nr:spore germination protein [Alicyclobacillaceae bacterium MYW30-H2]